MRSISSVTPGKAKKKALKEKGMLRKARKRPQTRCNKKKGPLGPRTRKKTSAPKGGGYNKNGETLTAWPGLRKKVRRNRKKPTKTRAPHRS